MKGKELRTVIPTRSKAGLQMPIQSTCVRCGQKLSVGSRQAGEEATCLQCGETQKIPTGPPPHDQPAEQHEDAGLPEDPYAEFAVHDDAEWVYEDEPSRERRQLQPVVRDLVAVPRRVIYLQGLLLGAVAVVSFSIGILVAGRGADPEAAVDRLPCLVSGVLSYRSASGLELPDSGAVVIALPVDRRPGSNERAAIVGLRPDDPVPKPSHESLQTIRALGGATSGPTKQAPTSCVYLPRATIISCSCLPTRHARRVSNLTNGTSPSWGAISAGLSSCWVIADTSGKKLQFAGIGQST